MVFGIPFPLSDRSHHVQRRVVKDTRPSAINYIQYVSHAGKVVPLLGYLCLEGRPVVPGIRLMELCDLLHEQG